MLKETGGYRKIKDGIVTWLKEKEIPYLAPDPLPSDLYADASHPLPGGYLKLARELIESGLLYTDRR